MGLEVSEAESIDIDNLSDLKIASKKLLKKTFIKPSLRKNKKIIIL